MDAFAFLFNGTYNETFNNIMDNPLIRFADQSESTHRQLVFIKCFMIANMENKDHLRNLVQRLQTHMTTAIVSLVLVMLALSSELAWKALPLILFCYSCQTLKFFAFESNLRRGTSFVFNVLCCIEVLGFEFVFDVYFVLCFIVMGLYSLYVKKDLEGVDRTGIQRISVLMFFLIEIGLFYYTDVVDYKFTLLVNAAITVNEAVVVGKRVWYIACIYSLMAQFILTTTLLEVDVDANFNVFIHYVWDKLMQYSGIV